MGCVDYLRRLLGWWSAPPAGEVSAPAAVYYRLGSAENVQQTLVGAENVREALRGAENVVVPLRGE